MDYIPRPRDPAPPAVRDGVLVRQFPKEELVRSEPYRRLVAARPCIRCGVERRSQAAHPNKGKGGLLKTDDTLCFPLCGPVVGDPGCHGPFDQGALYGKEERRDLEAKWSMETRRAILSEGLWPAGLVLPDELADCS